MTIAIGIVMTDHIVAGRLEDQRLTGKLLRFPADAKRPGCFSGDSQAANWWRCWLRRLASWRAAARDRWKPSELPFQAL